MCEYCGCRQVEPIADLMDEHLVLLEVAGDLRRALLERDTALAEAKRSRLVELLTEHVGREEDGVFAALKAQGEYVEEVDALEAEHLSLDESVAMLDLESPRAVEALDRVAAELSDHIDKENLGIFPVAVVTLGATGWDIVERAHARTPAATRATT